MKVRDLTSLVNNLPMVPGIHGRDEYFNSVVLLLLIPVGGEYHIVFQERSAGIRQGGEISLPGGRAEDEDISPQMTAVRETSEELGIAPDRIHILGRMDTVVALMGATVDVVVGTADIGVADMRINKEEVERIFTLPVSYFEGREPEEHHVMLQVHPSYMDKETGEEIVLLPSEELGLPERYRQPWGGYRYRVLVYRTPHGVIWGITARVINEFISRLNH